MKKKLSILMSLSIFVVGCSTASKNIASLYVSPMQYHGYDCNQLTAETQRIHAHVNQLAGRLDEASSNDKIITGVGLVIFWPVLFALGGTSQQESEYARLKGEYEAVQKASVLNKCSGIVVQNMSNSVNNTSKKQIKTSHANLENTNKISSLDVPSGFDIEQVINAWSQAWSSEDIESYLSFYSDNFIFPKKFSSRNEWEGQRYQSFESAGNIQVTLTNMKVTFTDETHARVTFSQDYRSDTYRDRVKKTLSLQKEGDTWKITRELS